VARDRLSRSELRSQDEITTTLQNVGEKALARKNDILIWGGIALGIVVIFFSWRTYAAGRTADAQRELGAAIMAFKDTTLTDTERYEKTVAAAQKTMNEFPNTPSASMAQYFLGVSQAGLGDKTNAIKNLEEVIGRGDSATKPVAQFALAGIYKAGGEYDKAIGVLKQLEASGEYSKSAVAFDLGAAAEAAGQKDQAQTYYGKVITESPDSPFRTDAENALKAMGLPIPTPPAAPAPGAAPAGTTK